MTEARLDVSARRILREKFELGLFENPYVDEDAADDIVGRADFRAAGEDAQRASITVLSNDGALPFVRGRKLYVEGIDAEIVASFGEVVETPGEADLAIIRLPRPVRGARDDVRELLPRRLPRVLEQVIAHVREVAAAVPTVVDVLADRPPILTPIVEAAAAVTVNWGASGAALLDVLSGAFPAQGTLPFDLPRSMAAVEASRPDVPFDTADPLFRFGHGLSL